MKKLKKLTVALALSAIFATGAVHAAVLDFTSPSVTWSGNVVATQNVATLGLGLDTNWNPIDFSTLTMAVSNLSSFQWNFTSQTSMPWSQWAGWFESSYVSLNGGSQILLADMLTLNGGPTTSWQTFNLGGPFSGTLTFGINSNYSAVDFNGSQSTLQIAAVPEPETYAMLLAGLGLLGFTARRRKNLYA